MDPIRISGLPIERIPESEACCVRLRIGLRVPIPP